MTQLYFLSIVCNSISGYLLFAGNEDNTDEKGVLFLLNNPTFQLVIGILSAVTGVLKLLSPAENGWPILGDLVPAVAGIFAGFIIIFGIYRRNNASASDSLKTLDGLGISLLKFRKPLGLGLLVISLLHFLFPKALFL